MSVSTVPIRAKYVAVTMHHVVGFRGVRQGIVYLPIRMEMKWEEEGQIFCCFVARSKGRGIMLRAFNLLSVQFFYFILKMLEIYSLS